MKNLIFAFLALVCAGTVRAAIHTETVEYKQGGTTLEGFVAYNDTIKGARPGVLVVHQWLGLTDYEKHRAEMLAQLGYVAFCADIYGKGVRPHNPQEAGAQAGKYKNDRQLLRARVNAGLDALAHFRRRLGLPALSIAVTIASLDSSKLRYNTLSPRRQAACAKCAARLLLPVPAVPETSTALPR